MRKVYTSKEIAVSFDPALCIHSERCVAGSPEVFKPQARPWIQPANSDANSIAATVSQCPTGALRYERLDGGPPEAIPTEVVMSIQKDGPIYVRGPMPLIDASGNRWEDAGHRYALCRCGGSGNKPFCDGTHHTMGFEG